MAIAITDPPSPDAKILPLRPAQPVDGLVELFEAAEHVREVLHHRRGETGWRFIRHPETRPLIGKQRRRRRPARRPRIEELTPDAVVLVILAGPERPWWTA